MWDEKGLPPIDRCRSEEEGNAENTKIILKMGFFYYYVFVCNLVWIDYLRFSHHKRDKNDTQSAF